MAKHIKNLNSCSNGKRLSSSKVQQPVHIRAENTDRQTNSSIREAFDSILLKNIKPHCKELVKHISSGLNRSVGLVRANVWNSSLYHKTAEKLNAKGGWDFKNQPRMKYDQMCAATQED